ncbi:MAG: hypothetical protein JWM39_829 [Parcubacteria group bacterium]|nr:hypothetical protein [Parcubacteria group bacterium]
MKIALCISAFHAGGGERVMITVANELAARGHSIDLLVLKSVGPYASHVTSSVRVIPLDASRMLFSLPKLVSYLKDQKPNSLMALDEYSHLLSLAARYISKSDTRIVLRVGNMFTEVFKRYEGIKGRTLEFLIRRWYRYADGIIAVSQGVKDDIVALTHIASEHVTVIYHPKDIVRIQALAEEPVDFAWIANKTVPVFIASGRLNAQKNFPLLLRAFARVQNDMPSRLIILGAGREEEALRNIVRELRIENEVSFSGYIDNPYAWLAKGTVFVSTSLWEGMPNALIEAMICGLPVISSDCASGPREVLAPDTDYRARRTAGWEEAEYGILTAVNDEQALVEAMQKLGSDEILRATYAKKGIERGRDFSMETILPAYEKALGASLT